MVNTGQRVTGQRKERCSGAVGTSSAAVILGISFRGYLYILFHIYISRYLSFLHKGFSRAQMTWPSSNRAKRDPENI